MKICFNCEYPMEEQEFNNPNKPEEPEIGFFCPVCNRHDYTEDLKDEVMSIWYGDVI